ncbi:MAG: flavin monoamine oxidase family protein [Acidobacteriaceae bacterium]
MAISRRDFLMRVGQAGGYSATFVMMQSLGLLPMTASAATKMDIPSDLGKGVSVVVLGGGIAGLVAAYELGKAGYKCTLLEARERPGGRVWTLRKGGKVEFVDGTVQTCAFDEGNYQNAGAARLPSVFPEMLKYCREFEIPLEVEVNTSSSTFLQNDKANDGKAVVQRKVANDTRGHVSELLTKAIRGGSLSQELTKEDREKMLDFLRYYGPLDSTGKYVGSDRAGYSEIPGAGNQKGIFSKPSSMHTLLDEDFWRGLMYSEAFDWQPTMFQPVGGMDRIPYAFAKRLGDVVQYNAPVKEIRRKGKGVHVVYEQDGMTKSLDADYCFCAMPLSIVKKTPNDFSAPFKKAIDGSFYAEAYKVAWESRRFWEQDYNLYGGLSFVNYGCSPIWYPSASMFSERGVVVSGYADENGTPFGSMTIPEKFEESRKSIDRVHPGHSKELEKGIYIGWGKIKYNEGSWIHGYGGGVAGYETLIQPDGPFYFVGDHVSHIVGWQEGAAVSSLRAVKMLSEHVKQAKLITPAKEAKAV